MKKNLLVFLLYFVISLVFLRGVVFSRGIIMGSDWSLPLTASQMKISSQRDFYTWSDHFNLLGARFFNSSSFFDYFFSHFSKIGLNGESFSKILLITLFSLIGFSSYYFCRKIGLCFKSSFLAGFIYMTTPLVFNYSIMGWIFVLLVMIIIPFFLLAFKLSVEKEKIGYSIIAGLLFAIALLQSQAIFWFPLLMVISFPFLVSSKRQFLIFLRSFLIVTFIAVLLHANWILPLGFSLDKEVVRTVSAFDIGRFETRLSFINMFRLWGGLFNYQFETAYSKFLLPISFVLPVLAFSSLILRKRDKKVLYLAAIALLPLAIYSLRGILYRVPFSNIIRDFSRMMVLSAFPYSVLAAITFEEIRKIKTRFDPKFLLALIILLIFLNSLPFWTGELYGEPRVKYDQRLRTLKFPKEYRETEEFLLKDKTDTKALFLPSGFSLGFLDNKKFYGPYKEVVDFFAALSSKPGGFLFSDKSIGPGVDYGKLILNSIENGKTAELGSLLRLASINNFVIRKNAYGAGGKGPEIEKTIEKLPGTIKVFDEPKVTIYQNKNLLPHFYIPQNIIYSNGDIETLPDIVSFKDYKIRSGVHLSGIVDKASEELIPLIGRADEISVTGEMGNKVSEEELKAAIEIKELYPPYVRWQPGSFIYPLILKKEQVDEWKERNYPEKLLDKKLFYASKRISEVEKFGTDDKELITEIMNRYQVKIKEAIELLRRKDWRSKGTLEKNVIKTKATIKAHLGEIMDLDLNEEEKRKAKDLFEDLQEEIENLKTKRDFSKLVYNFKIPQKGSYKLFLKNEDFIPYLESDPFNPFKFILDEKESEIEGRLRSDGWVEFDEIYFNPGEHRLVLLMPRAKNLVEEAGWQVIEEVYRTQIEKEEQVIIITRKPSAVYESLEISQEAKGYLQEIKGYEPDALFRLAFDYSSSQSLAGVAIEETFQEKEGAVVSLKGFLPKTEEGRFERLETFFKSSLKARGATIYLFTKEELGIDVRFKNIRIERVFEPRVVARSEIKKLEERNIPKITFIKINPTKYKVKVEEAKEPYTLVFSESFHQGWKAYISDQRPVTSDQHGEVVASYFDGEIEEGTHKNVFLDRNSFETLGKKSIPEERHLLVNGYANSWYITPEDVGGKENYEIVIEFWPQRLFYVSLGVSLITLLGCLGYLGSSFVKNKTKG